MLIFYGNIAVPPTKFYRFNNYKYLVMNNLRILALLFFVSVSSFVFSQKEVCETTDDSEIDLSSITKCAITPLKESKNKRTRQIRVKVSARRRVLKRKAVTSTNTLSTSGVNSSSIKSSSLGVLSTSNKVNVKKSIEKLKSKLSKEEVGKALRFTSVDEIPDFNECEKVKKSEKSDCFNNEMINHISKYFNYPGEAVRAQKEGEVWVRFIIDKEGYVKNIKTLGPDNGEILNNEAIRVVSKLPRFKPAKKDGKRISVKYGFPINFSLEE